MGEGGLDLDREYREYLTRFDATHGSVGVGKFVKHRGHLVKKLRFEEFEPAYLEYVEVARTYFESMERGDTINDVVVKVLRERADELLLACPV